MIRNCHNLCCPRQLPFQTKNAPPYIVQGYCSEKCWQDNRSVKNKKTCHFCSTEIQSGIRIKKQNYCGSFCYQAERIIADVNGNK